MKNLREILFLEIGCLPAAGLIVVLCMAMGARNGQPEKGLKVGLCLVGSALVLMGLLIPIVEASVTYTERRENKWYLDNPRLDPFGFSKRYFKDPKNRKWLERKQAKEHKSEQKTTSTTKRG